MQKKVTIVGGGSSIFVPQLMRLFIRSEPLRGSMICLMDVDARRLEVMASLARHLVEREEADLTVESTTDQRESLTGADFVIVAISVGGMDAWELDIEVPARYGVFMFIADSIGPGGMMRAFRHVPIMAGICRTLAEVSPRAVVLNYTNPATVNTMAMQTAPAIRSASLCTCTRWPREARFLSELTGVPPEEIAAPALAAGINHCAGIASLRLKDGTDAMPLARERISEPIVAWLMDTYGILPYCWTHWLEFYPQLQRLEEPYSGRAQGLLMRYGRRIFDMDEQRSRALRWQDLAERWSLPEYQDEVSLANLPAGKEDEGIDVVEVIESIVENRNAPFIVNVANHGAIDNLPVDAVVEVNAGANTYGIEPVHVGPLPEALAAHLRQHLAVQQLTLEAGLTGDRKTALQAFLHDPLLASNLEPPQIEKLLDELLSAQSRFLPQFS